MHTYISLLRGINVSGKNKLPMTTLKDLYQALGCMHVTTYIQSGNVILQTASSITALEHNLSQAIKEKFGYTVPVLVREVAFFSSIVAQNPFKDCDPSTLYVTLLGDATHQAQIASMADGAGGADRFVIQEGVIYVHCPTGYGSTPLNNNFFEKQGKTWATTRNWKTINRLVALAR
jgi:uncharacterized protein (DUF1697 family)